MEKIRVQNINLLESKLKVSENVKNLGVLLDSNLSMADHTNALVRSCFFQLRQLRVIRRCLPREARETLVQAFIGRRLDYCNSLLLGIGEGLMNKLQRVQNAAARLICGVGKFAHASPILRSLHWLPIRQRVEFKIATLVHKCLQGTAPSYLTSHCIPLSTLPNRWNLRSASAFKLHVPVTRTKVGARAFSVSGPSLWNSLPDLVRNPNVSHQSFRKTLKTILFERAYSV